MLVEKISHSALKTYKECPALFFYKYVEKIEVDTNAMPLVFGKALHAALEHDFTGKDMFKTFKEEFKPELLNAVDQLAHTEQFENGVRLLKEYEKAKPIIHALYGIEIKEVETYFKLENVFDPVTLDDLLFKYMTGRTDFVTTDDRIGDYKTSSKKYKQEDVDSSWQPTFYYIWYWMTYKKWPKSFIYIVFLKKHKREPIQVLETTRTPEQVSELITEINEVFKKVENREFERCHDDSKYCDCYKYEEKYNYEKFGI